MFLVPRLWPSPPRTLGVCLRLSLSSAIIMIMILSRGLIQLARAKYEQGNCQSKPLVNTAAYALKGLWQNSWCFDNAHENDDHLVVKTLVAVNNSPTQDYNVHSPDKSYSTLLKYYRQPNISLTINCTWKCLSLSAIKGINLLNYLTFSLPKKTLRSSTENF